MLHTREKLAGWVAEYCAICRDVQPMTLKRIGTMQMRAEGADFSIVECSSCGQRTQTDPATYLAIQRERSTDILELMRSTHPRLPLRIVDRIQWERRAIAGDLAAPERAEMIREPFLALTYLAPRRAQIHIPPLVALIFALVYSACLAIAGLAGLLASSGPGGGAPWPFLIALIPAVLASGFATFRLNRRTDRRFYARTIAPKLARALRPLRPTLEELQATCSWLTATASPLASFITPEELLESVRTTPDQSLTNADTMDLVAMARHMWEELSPRGEDETEHVLS